MNDAELRAAAEEVARALGLTAITRQCDVCGFQSNDYVFCPCHNDTRSNKTQMRTTVEAPLNLLTDAGALRLWDTLTEKYGVHSNTIRWAATEDEEAFVIVQVSLHPKCVLKTATTWPAALVLAAHAALRAGWLEEGDNV